MNMPYAMADDAIITKINLNHEVKPLSGKIIGEEPILRALLKYGFCTTQLIEREMFLKKSARVDVGKAVRALYESGSIEKYRIERFPGSTRHTTVVYTLSEKKTSELEEKYERPVYRFEMTDIAYILRQLSIEQWHIAALEAGAKEYFYNARLDKGVARLPVTMPSMVRIRLKNRKRLFLCAVPAPKGTLRRDNGAFLRNLIDVQDYMMSNLKKFPNFIIIIPTESTEAITDISRMLDETKETEDIAVLYSTDDITSGNLDPMKHLLSAARVVGTGKSGFEGRLGLTEVNFSR